MQRLVVFGLSIYTTPHLDSCDIHCTQPNHILSKIYVVAILFFLTSTMQKIILLLSIIVFSQSIGLAQTDCTNIGFELGNANGWILSSGTLTDDGTQTIYGPETSGANFQVTSISDGNDPKITNENIPMVAAGSKYAIRLGNTTKGGTYDRLRTSFIVTEDNSLFQYKFAVFLQNDDRGHTDFQKPGFNIQITDDAGNPLSCSTFDVQLSSSGTTTNFSTQSYTDGTIEYRNWTIGAINLRNYIGQKIKIVVTTHGCTKEKHFGYAYFDAQCLKSEVNPIAVCPDEDGFMTLKAPDGFGKYTWSNGETGSTIKVKANLGDIYSVKILPLSSLDATCELKLQYQIKYQHPYNTINATICEGENYVVGPNTYTSTGKYIYNFSRQNVCDSTVTLNLIVNPIIRTSQTKRICAGSVFNVGSETYSSSGTYITTIPRAGKCDSVVTTNLKVLDFDLSVENKDFNIISGESVSLKAIVTPVGNYTYSWKPDIDLICATCAETIAKPSVSRQYVIYANSVEGNECQKVKVVNISVRNCGIVLIPDMFSPNNDNTNDIFLVYASGCVKQIKTMKIFNRWGELIFWKENIQASDASNGWDGTYKGMPAETGSYVYQVEVELNDGTTYQTSGSVLLMR